MLIRQKPENIEEFVGVTERRKKELEKLGYHPMYLYDGMFFFSKNEVLNEVVINDGY